MSDETKKDEEPQGTEIVETPEEIAEKSAQEKTQAEVQARMEAMQQAALTIFNSLDPGMDVRFEFFAPAPQIQVPGQPPQGPRPIGTLNVSRPAVPMIARTVVREVDAEEAKRLQRKQERKARKQKRQGQGPRLVK